MDHREEKIRYKIREAQMLKIPYMLVIGDQRSQENGQVNVRKYGEQKSEVMPFEDFLEIIKGELK